MSDCKPCIKERVDKLIQNNKFEESDREYLESQPQEKLDKFLADVKPAEEVQVNSKKVSKEAAIEVLRGSMTAEDLSALLPKETVDQLNFGLGIYKKNRQDAIAKIMANTEVYTKEELEAKDFPELEKIYKLSATSKVQANQDSPIYSLFGNPAELQTNKGADDVPAPLTPTNVRGL